MNEDHPKLKFIFKSEQLDWKGKVKTHAKEVSIPWITYDPVKMMTEAVVSGDVSKFPSPYEKSMYATDFMRDYSEYGKYFEHKDFNRYVSVESEPVNNNSMKFVVYDRHGNNMKWVEI